MGNRGVLANHLGMASKNLLFGLPPEIMELVTSFLTDILLTRLILVGNRYLTSKLAQEGSVTVLVAKWSTKSKFSTVSLVRIFRSLKSLEICATSSVGTDSSGFTLKELPRTLQSLKFLQPTIWQISAILGTDFSIQFPKLTHLQVMIGEEPRMAEWLALMPPTLTSLEFSEFSAWIPLPPSVTRLVVHSTVRWALEMYKMSPNLRELHLARSGEFPAIWINSFFPSLPASLEVLTLPSYRTQWDLTNMSSLPPLLTSLDAQKLKFPKPLNEPFPVHLTSLSLGLYSANMILSALPISLTLLEITHTCLDSLFNFFAVLPPRLRSLKIDRVTSSENSNTAASFLLQETIKLPPTLQRFFFPSSWDIRSFLASIPSSIMDLHVNEIFIPDAEPGFVIKDLIDSFLGWPFLKSLSIGQISISPMILFAFLDKRRAPVLQRVTIADSSFTHPPRNSRSVTATNHLSQRHTNFLLAWRATLTRLVTATADLNLGAEKSVSLPSFMMSDHLFHFDMNKCDFIGDEYLEVIPKSIQSLELPISEFFTDYGVHTFIQHFSQLQTLDLSSESLTGAAFKSLPRNLTKLLAKGALIISDNDILDLPRSITYLDLRNAMNLSNGCAPFLPPRLTMLLIERNVKINKAIVTALPKSLLRMFDSAMNVLSAPSMKTFMIIVVRGYAEPNRTNDIAYEEDLV